MSSVDVDWLIHSTRSSKTAEKNAATHQSSPPLPQVAHTEPTPPQSPIEPVAPPPAPSDKHDDVAPHEQVPPPPHPSTSAAPPAPAKDSKPQQPVPATPPSQPQKGVARPSLGTRGASDGPSPLKGAIGNLKKEKDGGGRRSSWISSFSSKFSSSSEPKRNTSVDSTTTQKVASPKPSPQVEFGNPFDSKMGQKDPKLQEKKEESKKQVITPIAYPAPRRQSVLVAAGKETKLEHPGFLSSALRRLSSSTNASMGKGAGHGAICPRKVMNIDQNRERIKISEFDQNKLKRVAFCVDVEIAGYAAQADEEPQQNARPPLSGAGQRASLSGPSSKKDSKDAKYKDKGEGAALKNPAAASVEKETQDQTMVDAVEEAKLEAKEEPKTTEEKEIKPEEKDKAEGPSDPQPIPTTRKKEKKKRSEAERKERQERRKRHAEQNGLVPLELTRDDDDDSESSPGSTPSGASTPRKSSDSPTTDPLRIYKRCCQLRETTVLSKVKEQISKPVATLAEAPGTVAVVDLSGTNMLLQDIVTLGDWLAVVPVRKLVLNDCNLSDEAVRVILSGLSGCKSSEQTKANRKLPRRLSGKSGREQMGVIEKLSLKNNPAITSIGWKHIALFLHMSKSLKAIDLSGIPFPKTTGDLSRTTTASSGSTTTNGALPKTKDIGALIARAVTERLGDKLEELIMGGCGLSTQNISDILDAAIKCKIRRLGIAGNALDQDALLHVVRYIKSGACEGLDLGGINLHGTGHIVADALDENNPLFAISFADCKLDADDLTKVLKPLAALKNLKFVDLSQNPDLFKGPKNAVSVFRKLLPRLKELKRIHLADCGLMSDHVIALADILPDCPSMCHLSILENEPLVKTMNSKDGASQEEACAFFASLMTAVRVSQTIIAIEIEVPGNESSEVVKALASQVVAYSLRNMERGVEEFGVKSNTIPDKDAPEVLLHLVGHMDGYNENHDLDDPAPDEDYVIASTGIVKALSVCLGTRDGTSRTHTPRNASPTASGPGTPRQGPLRPKSQKKPRDVSLELCESARKIRMRLRPALVKEDKAGNDMDYRKLYLNFCLSYALNTKAGRLYLLDQTLQRMIQRFEDEYPETKIPPLPPSEDLNGDVKDTLGSSLADESVLSASATDDTSLSQIPSSEDYIDADQENRDPISIKMSRTPSNTSLAAKAYTNEEGRMLKFGQSLRREVLKPTGMTDHLHGVYADEVEPEHLAKLRERLEDFKGDEIRQRVLREGSQKVIDDVGMSAKELAVLRQEDPEGWKTFADSQLAAQLNMNVVGAEEGFVNCAK